MHVKVERRFFGSEYTIGSLYVDGERFKVDGKVVDTLEDTNRDLNKNGKFDNGEKKVYGKTCIPFGTYDLCLDFSPKFSKKSAYASFLRGGRMPHVRNVPSFEGILIHGGNSAADTLGCLLIGFNTIKGRLTNSLAVFKAFYKVYLAALDRGEKVTIEYTSK